MKAATVLDPGIEREISTELALVQQGHAPLDLALNKIVVSVANQMQTDVASLYRLEPTGDSLLLVATVGLVQSCVGRLRMRTAEGLVGLVAEQHESLVLAYASEHPRFKYFPEADEDRYQSFNGVPVTDRGRLLGVLVVQTIEPRSFTTTETAELEHVADRLAPILRECCGP